MNDFAIFEWQVANRRAFEFHGAVVRCNLATITRVLADPCVGVRLRQPRDQPEGARRWDEFCRIRLAPGTYRLVYTWDPSKGIVCLVMIGLHVGSGRMGDVYDLLQQAYSLGPSDGHEQERAEPCCDPAALSEVPRLFSGRRAEAGLRQLSRRR